MIEIAADIVDIPQHDLAVGIAFLDSFGKGPEDIHAAVELVFVNDIDPVGIHQRFRQCLAEFELHRLLHLFAEIRKSIFEPARLDEQFLDDLAEVIQNDDIVAVFDRKQYGKEYMPAEIGIDHRLHILAEDIAEYIAGMIFAGERQFFAEIDRLGIDLGDPLQVIHHFDTVVPFCHEIMQIDVLGDRGAAFLEVGCKADGFLHLAVHQFIDTAGNEQFEALLIHADLAVLRFMGDLVVHDLQLSVDNVQIVADGSQHIAVEIVIHDKIGILVYDFMLDLAPECMYQRLDLQFEIDAGVVERIEAVDTEDRKTVALDLGLRHLEVHIDVVPVDAADTVAVVEMIEVIEQLLVDLRLVADKTALDRNADQVRKMFDRLFRRAVIQIELVADQFLLEAVEILDAGLEVDDRVGLIGKHVLERRHDLFLSILKGRRLPFIVFECFIDKIK